MIMATRLTGDQEPLTGTTGEEVTEIIKAKCRKLGYIEIGITRYDHRYTYQSKRDWVEFARAICLAYEPTQAATGCTGSAAHELPLTCLYQPRFSSMELNEACLHYYDIRESSKNSIIADCSFKLGFSRGPILAWGSVTSEAIYACT